MLLHYNGNNIPANAVFDFSRSLTYDVTVSQIMETLTESFYPTYYNLFLFWLGVNKTKAKNAISGQISSKLMAIFFWLSMQFCAIVSSRQNYLTQLKHLN